MSKTQDTELKQSKGHNNRAFQIREEEEGSSLQDREEWSNKQLEKGLNRAINERATQRKGDVGHHYLRKTGLRKIQVRRKLRTPLREIDPNCRKELHLAKRKDLEWVGDTAVGRGPDRTNQIQKILRKEKALS
ncbi:hypothetical protein ACH5RR_026160 [Cinchona calisaya]|uniref:Uncharacterized protein n=1 Tax=Cinchona calisaya TaxID=153742 RepID=A0ABD2Z2V5_9GENT